MIAVELSADQLGPLGRRVAARSKGFSRTSSRTPRRSSAAIIVSHDAQHALALIDDAAVEFSFSALILPGSMSGVMLARIAGYRRPKLKVLLTTGYAAASLQRTDGGGSEYEVIDKPHR